MIVLKTTSLISSFLNFAMFFHRIFWCRWTYIFSLQTTSLQMLVESESKKACLWMTECQKMLWKNIAFYLWPINVLISSNMQSSSIARDTSFNFNYIHSIRSDSCVWIVVWKRIFILTIEMSSIHNSHIWTTHNL